MGLTKDRGVYKRVHDPLFPVLYTTPRGEWQKIQSSRMLDYTVIAEDAWELLT
jgi:hypothetical protein